MTSTTVYLLRHGATAANREVPYRLQGRAVDLPLAEEGVDQARRAAEALGGFALAAVYSSPLLRAVQTADRIAEPDGLVSISIPELIEADLGRWDGLTWDQARLADPAVHEAFHARPGTVRYPEGESFLDAQRRVVPAIDSLAAAHAGSRIAIVGHNVTNRAYLAALLGIPIDLARKIRQANCGINVIRYDGLEASVETMNSRFHLAP